MSATAAAPARTGRALKVTQSRVLRSEWTKLCSVRSTGYTLLVSVVIMIGISTLLSSITAGQFASYSAADRAAVNPVSLGLSGFGFAHVAIGVLGVLVISSEYGTGMIRASLTAVPRRLPVLWAKLAVFAGVVFSLSLVSAFVSFFLSQGLLDGQHIGVGIGAPGALRSVLGAALYMTVAGLIGIALGALLRSTTAAVSVFAGAFFVVPILAGLLPASISDNLNPYLPSNAGSAIFGGVGGQTLHNALSPWTGMAVLAGYAAVLIGAAAWRLRRADA